MPQSQLKQSKTLSQSVMDWEISPVDWLPKKWVKAAQVPIMSSRTGKEIPFDAIAEYMFDPKKIILTKGIGEGMHPHEYAHAAWFNDLDEADTKEWNDFQSRVYGKTKRVGRADVPLSLISDEKDPAEGFAKAFAMYVRYPKETKERDPELYDLMHKLTGIDYSAPYTKPLTSEIIYR